MRLTTIMNRRIREAVDKDSVAQHYRRKLKALQVSRRNAVEVYRAEFHAAYTLMFTRVNKVNHFDKSLKAVIQEKRKIQIDYFVDAKKAFVRFLRTLRKLDIKIGHAHHAIGKRRALGRYRERHFYRACFVRNIGTIESQADKNKTTNPQPA